MTFYEIPAGFRSVKVMKSKERLRNCHIGGDEGNITNKGNVGSWKKAISGKTGEIPIMSVL